MFDKDLESKRRLVALARKKAILDGTTLEAKVEKWLSLYVHEQGETDDAQIGTSGPSTTPTLQATITRTVKKVEKTSKSFRQNSDVRRGKDTRSAAYRRLRGVMSDSSEKDT